MLWKHLISYISRETVIPGQLLILGSGKTQRSLGVCAKQPSDIGILKDKPGENVSQVSIFPIA